MNWVKRIFARRRLDQELSEEMRGHVEELIEELVGQGMPRNEATAAARKRFGNLTLIQEDCREVWQWAVVDNLLLQVKLAGRRLWNSPGFAAAATLTLALGIGANVVVFSVLNALLLRPLDAPHPENVYLANHFVKEQPGWTAQSYRDYLDFRDRQQGFQGLAAYGFIRVGLSAGNSTIKSWGHSATGNYFDVLELQPATGRFFHASDEHGPGSAPFIVLSYDFWRRQFGQDPNVIGKTIELNRHPLTVIGVAPEGFHGIDPLFWPDYWLPMMGADEVTGSDDRPYRDHYFVMVFGRLKPGMTPQLANDDLNRIAMQMAKEDRKDDGLASRVVAPGFAGDANSPVKKGLLGMMLLAVLVLVAACSNLASIFAVRTGDRSGDLAVRMAIGSSYWCILRELLIEALLVSLAGGLVGTLVANVLLRGLTHWPLYGDLPVHLLLAPDTRVYLMALALSVVSGLLFGLLPARKVWRTDPIQAIKSGALEVPSFRRFALRDLLLCVQIAVCTLLVTASLVAAMGIRRSLRVPLGFDAQGITLAMTDLGMAGYSGEAAVAVDKRLLEEAQHIPGVSAAAITDYVPLQGNGAAWFVYPEQTTEFLPSHMAFPAMTYLVSPGYFQAAGTRLLAGRDVSWHDDHTTPNVAIVNETFARKLFGSTSVVGRRFSLWATARYEIAGVVQDGKYGSLDEPAQPAMFLPLAQGVGGVMSPSVALLVRSTLPPNQVMPELRRIATAVEPRAPFVLESWDDQVDRAMLVARAAATVLGIMGVLAAMLAITGIFGMASHSVSRRMREQGIRIALGAQRLQLMRSTLGRPLALFGMGLLLGLVLGWFTSQLLEHLVSFATPREPLVLIEAIVAMVVVEVVATVIPARRVLSADAAQLLREL